eukprot:1161779-Pelagomonas_calceolata.AAC.10
MLTVRVDKVASEATSSMLERSITTDWTLRTSPRHAKMRSEVVVMALFCGRGAVWLGACMG